MTRTEQLKFLIKYLAPTAEIPQNDSDKWRLFRSLVNVRQPLPVSDEFLSVQDEFLHGEIAAKGIVKNPPRLYKGDITTLVVDGIVNAANSGLLGCFVPCHGCIDNAIHTYAGVQLRLECAEIMQKQGHAEPTGRAKITKAYNLPSKYILHTVGPIIYNKVSEKERRQLADCYRSCLDLAKENGLKSLAFCCISTGEFRFPNEQAAEIAIKTVSDWKDRNSDYDMTVIFNVFKECDYDIYKKMLNRG